MGRKALWAMAVCVLLAGVAAGGWFVSGKLDEAKTKAAAKKGPRGERPVPVVAVAASTADVGVTLEGLGTVTPVATVTVRSRVDGQLMKILFREGQVVKAGELLAEIDPRPFQVQLAQAEAQHARDLALLRNAQVDLERYRVLHKQDSIARQQLDTQEALVRQTEATVKMDLAAIENARLQLAYSRITAPIGGRLGLRQVDLGNMVRAGDASGLVVITQLQPITVVFPIAEDHLPPVMRKLQDGEKLQVIAFDRAGKTQLATGTLITADNVIDPATGTVKLKAQFANADLGLFPSQFVNVRMLVDTRRGATVVPSAAILRGTPGTFVYAVDRETRVVSVRRVKLGPAQGEQVAIEEGLKPGVLVVVDGTDRLREGSTVELVVRDSSIPKESGKRKREEKLSPEERQKRWEALNARIEKGEFGDEIRKLPEEERKKKMRELFRDKIQK
jgi:multidrug efflux system membrane fusion protein